VETAIFYGAAAIAVTCSGLGKGGFIGLGQLGTPLLALVASPLEAVAILMPLVLAQDVISVWSYRKEWSARHLLATLPGAVAGLGLAWLLADRASVDVVRLVVGAFLLLSLAVVRRPVVSVHFGFFWGAVAGFAGLLINAGGAALLIYLLPQRLPNTVFVGTMTMFFATVNVLKPILLVMLQQFDGRTLSVSASLLPLAVGSNLLGIWLVQRTSSRLFHQVARTLLVAVALTLIWQGWPALTSLAASGTTEARPAQPLVGFSRVLW
jgi:uncharacterized protein